MRVGLVGAGRMGAFHARVLAAHPEVEELLITDVDAALGARVAADVGASAAESVDQLIGRGVDALVIAAATSAHAELIHRGADAGLPTFCEKPIALDLPTTDEVVEHVRRAGIPLQIGFQRRFDAGYLAARELVRSGRLGTLYVVRMAAHDPEPPHEAYIPASGSIFRDLHIHDFDIVRFVTGQEIEEVYADGAVLGFEVFAKYDDVDTSVAILRLSGGTFGLMSGTRHDPLGYDIRMELFGSGDSVVVGWDSRTPLRSVEPGAPPLPGPAYRNFVDRFEPAYRAEMDAFVGVAAGRTGSPCTGEEAREALRAAIAADRSREERRPVSVDEIT